MSFLCGLCGSKKTSLVFNTLDYSVSNEAFSIYSCKACGVLISSPSLSNKQLLNYYDKKKYQSFKKTPLSFIDFIYNTVRYFNTKYKLALIRPFIKGPVLDYGSGSGFFASFIKKRGVDVDEYEPINVAGGSKKTTLTTKKLQKQKKHYSVITLWHVLEHINTPKETLLTLKGLLKKEGVLVVALPNISSYDSIFYGSCWAGYDLPRHRFHFNPLSFGNLCVMCGLKVLSVSPLYYDSYFVSILSEQNKKSFFTLIKGVFRGFLSNIRAKKSQNYSSLVYILKFH